MPSKITSGTRSSRHERASARLPTMRFITAEHNALMRLALRIRVAAYVARVTPSSAQLLVFDRIDYPGAGTQVPAGGVKPDETLHDAVLREVAEETGLHDIILVR